MLYPRALSVSARMMSSRAMEVYRANVMTKIQAGNLSELVRFASEYVYQVIRGAVCTYKLLNDRRRQIGAFHLAR